MAYLVAIKCDQCGSTTSTDRKITHDQFIEELKKERWTVSLNGAHRCKKCSKYSYIKNTKQED